jgi:hypothetical protein
MGKERGRSRKSREALGSIVAALILCMILFPIPAWSVEGAKMTEKAVLWPGEIDGWKIAEGPTGYDPATAYTYMNGAAELFIAYNMRTLSVIRYEKPSHPAIVLEVYRMATPQDAYGLFSFESDDPGAGIGQGSEFGGGLLRFWKGDYFVSVYGDGIGPAVEAATLRLGEQVASSIQPTGSPPGILKFLPDELPPFRKDKSWFLHSHILLNQRFFIAHANILNLSPDVDVVLGRYSAGKERVHLLLAHYPTRARAENALASFRKAYMTGAAGKDSVRTENNRWTALEQYGDYLAIAFDGPDESFAAGSARAALISARKETK